MKKLYRLSFSHLKLSTKHENSEYQTFFYPFTLFLTIWLAYLSIWKCAILWFHGCWPMELCFASCQAIFLSFPFSFNQNGGRSCRFWCISVREGRGKHGKTWRNDTGTTWRTANFQKKTPNLRGMKNLRQRKI